MNLHGTGAFLDDGSALGRPRAEWAAPPEDTRVEFLRGLAAVPEDRPDR